MKNKLSSDLKEYHKGPNLDDTQPRWNDGRGKQIRSAVRDEEGYDPMDDLPKHESFKKRYGWDSRDPGMRWRLKYRWLQAQVGRKMDDVRSEVIAKMSSDNYASRNMRREIMEEEYCVKCKPEIIEDADGWPTLNLISLDGSHIYNRYINNETLYVDAEGILQKVPVSLIEEANRLRKEYRKEREQSVTKIGERSFFKLHGSWVELTLVKIPHADTSFRFRFDFQHSCVLCKKLKIYSSPQTLGKLFGGLFVCEAIRTLGKKEIRDLGLK